MCIDLVGVNDLDQFRSLIKKIKQFGILIDERLWSLKSELKASKIFISKFTLEIVFIEVQISGKSHIGLYPFMSDKILDMKSFKIKKEMDVDSILERISKNGITSITKKEERILNNTKK